MKPLGPWIAVEPLHRTVSRGGLHMPTMRATDDTFPAVVLAVGDVGADVQRGDVVLVETMSGHPHMAANAPDYMRGQTRVHGAVRPVLATCDLFGGSPGVPVALVAARDLRPCEYDEQAARRLAQRDAIMARSRAERRGADDDPRAVDGERVMAHNVWLGAYEAYREHGRRRSRWRKPSEDGAAGEGVVAKLDDLADLLAAGADPGRVADVAERVGLVQ